MHFQCIRGVFGNEAIEAAGIAVLPQFQRKGIAVTAFRALIEVEKPKYLTAYTRNPSLIKAVAETCGIGNTFPFNRENRLAGIAATSMANATCIIDDNGQQVFHENRYCMPGFSGLYGGDDPAELTLRYDGRSLKEEFTVLEHVGNALIVAATLEHSND